MNVKNKDIDCDRNDNKTKGTDKEMFNEVILKVKN